MSTDAARDVPTEIRILFCPECGRDDRVTPFTGKSHWFAGVRCGGTPHKVAYSLALREQASPDAALIEALEDAGKLPDEWEHSAELESARAHDDSDAKVAVYRMCARELRAALAAARAGETT